MERGFTFILRGFLVVGAVASRLVSSTPDRAVRVRVMAGDILTAPLSTQVYKWVPANLILAGGNPAMDWHLIQGGVVIFLVA